MSYHYLQRTLPFKYHKGRIIHELREAGVTLYGIMKSESRFLPHIINEDEYIKAVIYGQHHSSSAMLIATDRRIIYLDKKPMAEFVDEISYEVVSGVEVDVHIFFSTVTLHTAVTNYDIHFVNLKCAEKFAQYIEEQRMKKQTEQEVEMKEEIEKFLPGYLYWVHEEEKTK